jgi:hypothetical protein
LFKIFVVVITARNKMNRDAGRLNRYAVAAHGSIALMLTENRADVPAFSG